MTIEYDGTDFSGFQRQRNQMTVQEAIETAAGRIEGRPVTVVVAGRTDAGVHAMAQVISFTTARDLSPEIWVRALNDLLPPTIAAREAWHYDGPFNPRYRAITRVYRYTLRDGPTRTAIGRQYVWHVAGILDVEAMDRALRHLIGTHDFSSFSGRSAGPRRSTVRTITSAYCRRDDGHIVVEIAANAFLPHMVRNIVGTIVPIGRGTADADSIRDVLERRDRSAAGPTAPPHGLCLVRVHFGERQ
ncbi:MAG: tRNA pseudouridine(38-40) synthase TruA [Chloroflexi bacterium]|nr:tRNA pseudouridine(38-40) synthase TruA [Chloroflexota bacterium]